MRQTIRFLLSFVLLFNNIALFAVDESTGTKKAKEKKIVQKFTAGGDFLDEIQKRAFLYFWLEANPDNGLVRDRSVRESPCSIASVGFGLTVICMAQARGWVSYKDAYKRVLTTLQTFDTDLENVHGFYYHFVDMKTGKRTWDSELSSIDTALFLAGAIFAKQYFKGTEVERLAQKLYERVDWGWMLNAGRTFSMGWTPESGFIKYRWERYAESMILYFLAIGAPNNPIPAAAWHTLIRKKAQYKGNIYITPSPNALFIHQYSHGWIDFRNMHDDYADYWANSISAAKANWQFCQDNKAVFKTYNEYVWGISASDGPLGYFAYEPKDKNHDGTVCPYSVAGSVPLIPDIALPSLQYIKEKFGNSVWGKYGFYSAFNSMRNWYSKEYIGIDQGITFIMIENSRTESVWGYFMREPAIQRAMKLIGFQPGTKVLEMKPLETVALKVPADKRIVLDGKIDEWTVKPVVMNRSTSLEQGEAEDEDDISANVYFEWDKDNLYAAFEVTDNEVINDEEPEEIYKGDAIELFLDPEMKNLIWGKPDNFQIGLAPTCKQKKPMAWAWWQGGNVEGKIFVDARIGKLNNGKNGYVVEAAIPWKFLNIKPETGKAFGISPAIHDKDTSDPSPECKLNWYFVEPGIQLGKITLVDR